MDQVPRSCGCREQTMLKKGSCPVILDAYKELSNMFILGFYNYMHLKLFRKPFKTSNLVTSNQIDNEIQ